MVARASGVGVGLAHDLVPGGSGGGGGHTMMGSAVGGGVPTIIDLGSAGRERQVHAPSVTPINSAKITTVFQRMYERPNA